MMHRSLFRFGTLIAALLLFCAPALAEVRTIEFRVLPPGAAVYEGGTLLATAGGDARDTLAFEADIGTQHTLGIKRDGFDDLALTLTWDSDLQRWRKVDATARVNDYLQSGEVLWLSKTVKINTSPAAVTAAIEVMQQETHTRSTVIYGRERYWLDLPRRADGAVTIPRAAQRQMVLLSRSMFADYPLTIEEGALTSAGAVFPADPVRLQPLYGPFSYWQFDVLAGVVLVVAAGAWFGVVRPRRAARHAEAERRIALADQVLSSTGSRAPGVEASLAGTCVTTDSGEGFVLLRELGRGAMGAVYEAAADGTKRSKDERWAVKMLFQGNNDTDSMARFKREVRICSTLHHPGIVKALDSGLHRMGESAEFPFIVMELVEGSELRDVMRQSAGPLEPRRATAYVEEILSALRTAHRAGIVHRDLKPANIMVTGSSHIKIMDFGIARATDQGNDLTKTGMAMGTPRYMSPEHVRAKEVTAASDIYSLGVIFYEMLSARLPFDSDDIWKLIGMIMSADPVPVSTLCPWLDPRLAQVVMKMMARSTEVRYRNADEVLVDLNRLGASARP